MKRLVLSAVCATALCMVHDAVAAFDNTVSNDFWDTTAYVNPAPSVSGATLAEAFDAFVFDRRDAALGAAPFDSWCFELFGPFWMMQPFTSMPRGVIFSFR